MLLLCVDDDAEDVDLLCEAMKTIDPSCICLIAHNGEEALNILETIKPDIILLDINMPVMDGRQTLKKIRSDRDFDEISIFMLSTTKNEVEMKSYLKSGASGFLTKPNSFNDLCKTLRKVLPPPVSS